MLCNRLTSIARSGVDSGSQDTEVFGRPTMPSTVRTTAAFASGQGMTEWLVLQERVCGQITNGAPPFVLAHPAVTSDPSALMRRLDLLEVRAVASLIMVSELVESAPRDPCSDVRR